MSLQRVDEPVGVDAAVQEALAVLQRTMVAAAASKGHHMQTVCLVWATEKDGDAFGGTLVKGDVSPDVMEFLAEIILDDGEDASFPDPHARRQ
jgi:hypothetical protein